ncbi:MAG: SDR family oxidoreductase [bacterium]|nr:SDR family oxidoreductase [bacterium]
MDLELGGRSILVTGGSSGLGLATTRLLLDEGAQVTICGRDLDRLQSVANQLANDRLETVAGNVLDPSQAASVVKAAVDRFGRLDGVAAIAGKGQHGSLLELDQGTIAAEISGKIAGLLNVTKQALPFLTDSQGSVVALTAPTAAGPIPKMGAISAARAALDSVVSSLALELAPTRVRVNAVGVGLIDTPRQRARHQASGTDADYATWLQNEVESRQVPLQRAATPHEVAAAVVFLLSPSTGYTTGAVLDVTGGHRSR